MIFCIFHSHDKQQVQQQQIVVNRQASMTGYISPLGSPQPIMSPNANPMQQMPQAIAINSSLMQGNGGFTVGVSNNSMANASTSSTNGTQIHNQNGLVQQMNAALLAERYLLLDLVEGSTLYKCIDVKTHEELVCKVRHR